MWQLHAQLALDLARERTREAERHRLAVQARASQAAEARRHGLVQPSRLRSWLASSLRVVSGAFGSVSDAACDAAARLDRRTA